MNKEQVREKIKETLFNNDDYFAAVKFKTIQELTITFYKMMIVELNYDLERKIEMPILLITFLQTKIKEYEQIIKEMQNE